jgi:hypothetical protein
MWCHMHHSKRIPLAFTLPTTIQEGGAAGGRAGGRRLHAKEREGGRAGLGRGAAGQRADHDAAGLRLPPRVDDGALPAPHHRVVPPPGLRRAGQEVTRPSDIGA